MTKRSSRERKPITVQRIHSVLRAAGYSRSESRTTRIRGWHHFSSGYWVDVHGDRFVVHYMQERCRDETKYKSQANLYAAALASAGIACELADDRVVVLKEAPTP